MGAGTPPSVDPRAGEPRLKPEGGVGTRVGRLGPQDLGTRIITYLPESVDRACDILRDEFVIVEELDKGELVRARGAFGYQSKHFLVRLRSDRAGFREYQPLRDKIVEIQVRTASQHAWAEVEHDIRYKVKIPDALRAEFDRRFTLAAALMELADAEFTALDQLSRVVTAGANEPSRDEATVERRSDAGGDPAAPPVPLDSQTLGNFLTRRYPDAPKSRRQDYAWMLEVLRQCRLTTVDDQSGPVEDRSELLRKRLCRLRP